MGIHHTCTEGLKNTCLDAGLPRPIPEPVLLPSASFGEVVLALQIGEGALSQAHPLPDNQTEHGSILPQFPASKQWDSWAEKEERKQDPGWLSV